MGWGKHESTIEQRRLQIAASPRESLTAIEEDLRKTDLLPRDRARLLGLRSVCFRHLGAFGQAWSSIAEANAIPKIGRLARAELALHAATLHKQQADLGLVTWDEARRSCEALLEIVATLSPPRRPSTNWGRRKERTRRALQATALVLYGQITLDTGNPGDSLKIGLEALQLLPQLPKAGPIPPHARQIMCGPPSLIAASLVKGATNIEQAFPIIEAAIRQLPQSQTMHRAILGALLACIMSRTGQQSADQAFADSLDLLRTANAPSSYAQILKLWAWSVKANGRPEHAAWIAENLADPSVWRLNRRGAERTAWLAENLGR